MNSKLPNLMLLSSVLASMSSGNTFGFNTHSTSNYNSPKLSGFTTCKGRKHLTKKQRKQNK